MLSLLAESRLIGTNATQDTQVSNWGTLALLLEVMHDLMGHDKAVPTSGDSCVVKRLFTIGENTEGAGVRCVYGVEIGGGRGGGGGLTATLSSLLPLRSRKIAFKARSNWSPLYLRSAELTSLSPICDHARVSFKPQCMHLSMHVHFRRSKTWCSTVIASPSYCRCQRHCISARSSARTLPRHDASLLFAVRNLGRRSDLRSAAQAAPPDCRREPSFATLTTVVYTANGKSRTKRRIAEALRCFTPLP